MSFLLRGREKRRGFGRGGPPQTNGNNRPSFRPNSGGGGGGRQGQVMLQRKQHQNPVNTTPGVQQQKTAHSVVTPQQQSQDGVISMDEVLRDLEILEHQQKESQQKLQLARQTKERKELQHAALEQELGNLKYRDGKLKAELAQTHKLLGTGQRALSSVRDDARKAEADLRAFDQNLGQALANKRVLLGYQRKHHRLMSRVEEKAAKLQRLHQDAAVRFSRVVEEADSFFNKKESIRHQIQEENLRKQSLSSQRAQLRGTASKLESEFNNVQKAYSTAKKSRDEIVISVADYESKHAEAMKVLNGKKATLSASCAKGLADVKQATKTAADTQQTLEVVWERHENIRLSYELEATPSSTIPSLDMTYFQQLLEKEKQATGAAETSKLTLTAEVEKRRKELADLEDEISSKEKENQSTCDRTDEKKKILAALQENEARRNVEAEKVSKKVQELEMAKQKKTAERNNMNAEIEERKVSTQGKVLDLKHQIDQARLALAEKNETLSALDDAHNRAQSKLKTKISVEKSRKAELSKECDDLTKKMEAVEDISQAVDLGVKQRIDEILANNPSLETLEVLYDPSLSVKEQAKRDLSSLSRECRRRIEAAKKMRDDLQDSARREAEERRAMQRQLEDERQRKEETRRRRANRLSEQKSTKADKSNQDDGQSTKNQEGKPRREAKVEHSDRDLTKASRKKDHENCPKQAIPEQAIGNEDKVKGRQKKVGQDIKRIDKEDRRKHKDLHDLEKAKEKGTGRRQDKSERSSLEKNKEQKDADYSGSDYSGENPGRSDRGESKDLKGIGRREHDSKRHGKEEAKERKAKETKRDKEPETQEVAENLATKSFSAAKPRNLLTTFSQTSKTVAEANKSVSSSQNISSSQKKVRWQENDQEASQQPRESKDETKKQTKMKKTFGRGNIYTKPNPFGASGKSTSSVRPRKTSTDAVASAKQASTKMQSSDREVKDKPSRERQSFGESRGRRGSGSKKLGASTSNKLSDPLAIVDGSRKSTSRSKTSADVEIETKRRRAPVDAPNQQSKRQKTDIVSLKRSSGTKSTSEQRATKRRRTGVVNADGKPGGAKSFGEDVAYSF